CFTDSNQTAGNTEMNETPETKKEAAIRSDPNESRSRKIAIVAVVAVVAVAVLALLLWRFIPRGNAGRPVPAPRNIGQDQAPGQAGSASGESTLTIAPEQAQRAGIKIETVGERVSTDATSQQTTGVVHPNSYRQHRVTC